MAPRKRPRYRVITCHAGTVTLDYRTRTWEVRDTDRALIDYGTMRVPTWTVYLDPVTVREARLAQV